MPYWGWKPHHLMFILCNQNLAEPYEMREEFSGASGKPLRGPHAHTRLRSRPRCGYVGGYSGADVEEAVNLTHGCPLADASHDAGRCLILLDRCGYSGC